MLDPEEEDGAPIPATVTTWHMFLLIHDADRPGWRIGAVWNRNP
jgi:hypothetical protein